MLYKYYNLIMNLEKIGKNINNFLILQNIIQSNLVNNPKILQIYKQIGKKSTETLCQKDGQRKLQSKQQG